MTRALIDVDGPLGDFNAHVLATVPGGPPDGLVVEDLTTYSSIFDLLRPDQAKAMKEVFLQDADWWADMPVTPMAKRGLEELRKWADEVVFVTSPWWSCKGWGWARRTWLYYNFDARPKDVCISTRKHFVGGEWFLDDKWDHVRSWIGEQVQRRRTGEPLPRAFLYDAPYNQGVTGVTRFTWGDYLDDPLAFRPLRDKRTLR